MQQVLQQTQSLPPAGRCHRLKGRYPAVGEYVPEANTEEEQLWSPGVLSSSTPKQLLNKVFFFAGKHFGPNVNDEASYIIAPVAWKSIK